MDWILTKIRLKISAQGRIHRRAKRRRVMYAFINKNIRETTDDPNFRRLCDWPHHKHYTRADHAENVARCAGFLGVLFKFDNNAILNVVKAGLLHDYFLYDYHEDRKTGYGDHGQAHAVIAAENAMEDFGLNMRQENAILSHMFPTGPWHIPKYKESWVVNMADKYCTVMECIVYKIKHETWRFRL